MSNNPVNFVDPNGGISTGFAMMGGAIAGGFIGFASAPKGHKVQGAFVGAVSGAAIGGGISVGVN